MSHRCFLLRAARIEKVKMNFVDLSEQLIQLCSSSIHWEKLETLERILDIFAINCFHFLPTERKGTYHAKWTFELGELHIILSNPVYFGGPFCTSWIYVAF